MDERSGCNALEKQIRTMSDADGLVKIKSQLLSEVAMARASRVAFEISVKDFALFLSFFCGSILSPPVNNCAAQCRGGAVPPCLTGFIKNIKGIRATQSQAKSRKTSTKASMDDCRSTCP